MTATLHALTPQYKPNNTDKYLSRIIRLEKLLVMACSALLHSEDAIVAWPKELVQWFDKNYPHTKLTFDDVIDQLSEDQIEALGLYEDSE